MRISTGNIFDLGTRGMAHAQGDLLKTQQQLASGQSMVSPSDDPTAASQALRVRLAIDTNNQYIASQSAATSTLRQAESVLGQVTSLLQDAKTLAVAAGNGTLQNSDRQSIAEDLSGRLSQLIGLSNADDGAGSFLFAGNRETTQPFARLGAQVTYNGDQGGRLLQVSQSRTIAVSENGAEIFQRIPQGNGVFTTAAGAGNSGSGLIDTGQVNDPAALVAHRYQIRFAGSGAATNYTVIDTTTNTAVGPATAYASGSAIVFRGVQVEISGQPASGDVFNLAPATSQSVFTTLQGLIDALNAPVSSAADRAALANAVSGSMKNIDNAFDHVLSVRTSMGSRLNELENLQTAAVDRDTALAQAKSQLEDIDYAEAASRLSRQQMVLQAAQQSFVRVTSLSLFDYL